MGEIPWDGMLYAVDVLDVRLLMLIGLVCLALGCLYNTVLCTVLYLSFVFQPLRKG